MRSNTIDAYARGVNDWLAFCHSVALTAAAAGRDTVALYVRSLHTGSPAGSSHYPPPADGGAALL
ncbi:hypothetical protein [Klebsiella pneumoniae]|uniref:hypothetical protein n=1 Tax=Klebsiella pneumoniae TaxID=573 RepID=UPI00294A10AC|nr:hypothetical protein [Klebsiella pneumoniae]MDV5501098.1 hypothetical protein [Klebsiella pneumoniae]